MDFLHYVKRAAITLHRRSVNAGLDNRGFTSSQLVLQVREENFKSFLSPDSIHKAVARLYSDGLLHIDADTGIYTCSIKLLEQFEVAV